ncbi:MAG: GH39 family glycosyl hydrolase, partial [Ilumatobacteraceae bacterium]
MVRNRSSLVAAAALVAASALALAACSSGGGEAAPSGSSASGSAAPVPANGVPASLVGMHVEGAEGGVWPSAPFGALRLWDNGTGWSQIELEPGVFKWDNLEGALENAESKGMSDILYVLGTTPEWAASKVNESDYPQPGAASAPKDLTAWDAWVTEVATRYKGRISAYQVWNEANLKNFWNGTPEEMADLTKRAYDSNKKVDPDALVVAASPSTRLTASFEKFYPAYLKALAAKGWPIDVLAIHTYPKADGDPVARGELITATQAALKAANAPDLPLWDTELNYGLAGPGALPKQEITGVDAAGWVVRTYLDDLRYGVDRSYWYIWTQQPYDLLGIQAYPGSDAEQGFFALENWVIGSEFGGCTDKDNVVACTFTRDGQASVVAWANSGEASYTTPEGAQLVCDPLANCTET